MGPAEIQYVSDASGKTIAGIVPIELWCEIESEREITYLCKSENLRLRLSDAKNRQDGLRFEEARERLAL